MVCSFQKNLYKLIKGPDHVAIISIVKQDFDMNNGYEQLAINFGDEFIFAFTMKILFDNEKVRSL